MSEGAATNVIIEDEEGFDSAVVAGHARLGIVLTRVRKWSYAV